MYNVVCAFNRCSFAAFKSLLVKQITGQVMPCINTLLDNLLVYSASYTLFTCRSFFL